MAGNLIPRAVTAAQDAGCSSSMQQNAGLLPAVEDGIKRAVQLTPSVSSPAFSALSVLHIAAHLLGVRAEVYTTVDRCGKIIQICNGNREWKLFTLGECERSPRRAKPGEG